MTVRAESSKKTTLLVHQKTDTFNDVLLRAGQAAGFDDILFFSNTDDMRPVLQARRADALVVLTGVYSHGKHPAGFLLERTLAGAKLQVVVFTHSARDVSVDWWVQICDLCEVILKQDIMDTYTGKGAGRRQAGRAGSPGRRGKH